MKKRFSSYEQEIIDTYNIIKPDIVRRIDEFKKIWEEGDSNSLFAELVFCLFTPQSSARQCWKAVNILLEKNLLFEGSSEEISMEINMVRFRNNKAAYLTDARERFVCSETGIKDCLAFQADDFEKREWLVKNIKGMGYKEASHFMRNIGMGEKLAILDRHILKNMKLAGVIDDIPSSLSRKVYLELEARLAEFSKHIGIPMDHLDFVLWYREAGEVFK